MVDPPILPIILHPVPVSSFASSAIQIPFPTDPPYPSFPYPTIAPLANQVIDRCSNTPITGNIDEGFSVKKAYLHETRLTIPPRARLEFDIGLCRRLILRLVGISIQNRKE